MEAIRDLLLAGNFFSISFPASVLTSASDWAQEWFTFELSFVLISHLNCATIQKNFSVKVTLFQILLRLLPTILQTIAALFSPKRDTEFGAAGGSFNPFFSFPPPPPPFLSLCLISQIPAGREEESEEGKRKRKREWRGGGGEKATRGTAEKTWVQSRI